MTSVAVDMELSIDKSDWKSVCLGDVVEESRLVTRDPVKEGIEKVVGLEHIDSESIHLRRWESLEQSTTFTKKFVKGQVLFGRRRAYLKKAALAPFDGICSGDITVLQAKESLLPELLPFLINNDNFFDFAVKNSAGSLSPRAKFKDLSNYEFVLPPKHRQSQMAELLWNADATVSSYLELKHQLNSLYLTVRENRIAKSDYRKISLEKLSAQLITYGIVQPGPQVDDGMPYIQSSDIKDRKVATTLAKTSLAIAKSYERSEVRPGDILFSLRGNLGDTAIVPEWLPVSNLARGVARISVSDEYDTQYVQFALETLPVVNKLTSVSQGSTFKEISLQTLRSIEIPIPNEKEVQFRISSELASIDRVKNEIQLCIDQFKKVQKVLINHIF
jgi:type I restriction enzyme S subunit